MMGIRCGNRGCCNRIVRIVLVSITSLFAVLFLLPMILTFTSSFMSTSELRANYGKVFDSTNIAESVYISEKVNLKFIPDMVCFDQYITVLFKSPEYLLKFWNSVILVVPIVLFQLLIASFAAYSFARYPTRWKTIMFFLYTIIMIMPYQVTLVPNYLVSDWLQIVDTNWAIWLPGIFSPFTVFFLTKNMRRIPETIIDAARVDGAGAWQIFFYICVPMCKNAIFAVAILIFIDYWNMVEQPLIMLGDPEMHPLSVFLAKINTDDVGVAFSVACIYMIPSLLFFLYGEDYLVEEIKDSYGIK